MIAAADQLTAERLHESAGVPAGFREYGSGLIAPAASFDSDLLASVGGSRHYRALKNDPTRRRGARDRYSSADSINELSLPQLRALSRDMARNETAYAGALETFVDTAFAGKFEPVPAPDWQDIPGVTAEEAEAFRVAAKREFKRWTRAPWKGSTLDWIAGVRLIARAVLEQFDCFLIRQSRPAKQTDRLRGPSCSLCWQILDNEQLADAAASYDLHGDDHTIAGAVERDGDGEPVALHVYERHPGDLLRHGGRASYPKIDRIPWYDADGRENVIAIFKPTRAGQSRGVSPLVPGMQLISDHGELQETALVALKVATMLSTFITKNPSNPNAPGRTGRVDSAAPDETRGDGSTEKAEYLRPGQINYLQTGEEIKSTDPPSVSPVIREMTETNLVQVGSLVGMSYEVLTRDLRQTNYSSARAGFELTWRAFGVCYDLHKRTYVRASYEGVIEEGVTKGRIPIPGFDPARYQEGDDVFGGYFPEWTAFTLLTSGMPRIDNLKEAQGDKLDLEMGTTTRAQIVAKRGGEYAGMAAELERENDEREEHNLTASRKRGAA